MNKKIIQLILVVCVFILIAIGSLMPFHKESLVSLTGNQLVPTKVNVIDYPETNCSFHLVAGWNLISFNCIGTFADRDEVLQPMHGSYTSIFAYNPADSADPWKSYNPTLPNWTVQQLNILSRLDGYWIEMNTSADYLLLGRKRSSQLFLYSGWNLVGYPSANSSFINDSLLNLSYTIVKSYDESSSTYLIYFFNGSSNTLNLFETSNGYWINSSASQIWSLNG